MKPVSPEIRKHRILGAICVIHSFLVLAVLVGLGWMDSPLVFWGWITFATLWFVWPFVLIFHRGRSIIRVTVPVVLGLLIYSIWGRQYSLTIRPQRFGFPEAVDLTPQDLIQYPIGYGRGWIDAKKDIRAGRLIVEPMIGELDYWPFLKMRYQVEAHLPPNCMINASMVGHATAYNRLMLREIDRRFGNDAVAAAIEDDKKEGEKYQAAEQAGRADAAKDLHDGRLAIEVFGRDQEGPDYKALLFDRYQVELRQLGNAETIRGDYKIIGHADGYNEISEQEIKRRFGEEASKLIMDAKNTYRVVGVPDWLKD